jgi:putrescine importer
VPASQTLCLRAPEFRTPVFTVALVGWLATGDHAVAGIGGVQINFGALIAFTFVNLSVIAYCGPQERYRTPRTYSTICCCPGSERA